MKRQVKVSVGRSVGYSVSESVGEGAAASVTVGTGLIDVYTTAIVAYSTGRRLRDNYTGALFRVRRSSDNAEQDIGFDAGTGLVDESALTTFVGANSGLVTTLYNQVSGGGFNATIGTASLQPTIVDAGVVQTLGTNSRPAPLWVAPGSAGGDDRLSAANLTLSGTELVIYWACRDTDHTYYRAICHYGTGSVGAQEFAVYSPDIDFGTDAITFYNNSNVGTTHSITSVPVSYVGRVRGNILSGSTLENIRTNAGAETAGSVTAGTSYGAAKNLHIGNRSDGIVGYAGVIGEFILYSNLSVATTDGVDTDMMTFWGIS